MSTRRPFAGPRFWRYLAAIAPLGATTLSVQGAPPVDFGSATFAAGTLFADPTASVQGPIGTQFGGSNASGSLYGNSFDLNRRSDRKPATVHRTAMGGDIHALSASPTSGDTQATPFEAILEPQIDALMLAGVGAIAFIARRRRAR